MCDKCDTVKIGDITDKELGERLKVVLEEVGKRDMMLLCHAEDDGMDPNEFFGLKREIQF